ncbi:acyl-CoA thioesterase [Parahaliea mediterranea]|uniref:acyl-CoA thioesterase n=1 Tax=Parahaliea mediterranea TaxID=651086 RepID=UPI000E2FEA60|nr:acyl-CoA thioesterase [Parahaliea mediterranea]
MSHADLPWDHPEPFVVSHTVSPGDIDGLEHTNNTVYVKWCEQAAWGHSVALGLDLDCYRRLDRAMAITRAEYDYLQASRAGDELLTATWIVGWDRRITMQRRFQIVRPADGLTLLRGAMQFACIEISSGRPRRMPAEFVEGYGPAVLDLA